jgi:hypothetical protein
MRRKPAKGVRRFAVEFEVANLADMLVAQRGFLPPDQVRRNTILGWVGPGAAVLVLP